MEWLTLHQHDGAVTELQLGHGPMNALTTDFLLDVRQTIQALDSDPDVNAILLSSPFADFCVGVTPETLKTLDQTAAVALETALNQLFLTLYACDTPTIVAVRGRVSGEGMFFVLASDLRVSHARARFELSQINQGTGFPRALMEIAKASLSSNTQRRLMLTGQDIGPIAARNADFIEIIADDYADLERYSLTEARKLAALPQDAYREIKHELRKDVISSITKQIATSKDDPGTTRVA